MEFSMKLNELRDNVGARKNKTRLGRGEGSGKGKTAGRGQKGQKSRSGVSLIGFEGGQMPLYRRIPKRGFNNPKKRKFEIINIVDLDLALTQKSLDASKMIDLAALVSAGLVSGKNDGVKLLGKGKVSQKVKISVDGASKKALAAIEDAGGEIVFPELTKSQLEAQRKSSRRKEKLESNSSKVSEKLKESDEVPEKD